MKKIQKTPLAIAMGASLLPLTANLAQADSNPFALTEMSAAYMQTAEAAPQTGGADKMKDGACGEGKCGAGMTKPGTTPDKKAVEGKCAGNKAAPANPADAGKKMDGNCGANMKK
jgi:uncharacterized low-complexity protein